jgi:hypothetical protein
MATTVGSFSAIDDTEIDAESPITETLMTRMRDNSYWIDAGTKQTTQTSTTKVLTPDGSGGVQWVEVNNIAGVDGTKGVLTLSATYQTITSLTSGILFINSSLHDGNGNQANYKLYTSSIIVDLSDDTFSASGSSSFAIATTKDNDAATGTITSSDISIVIDITMRRSSGNLQIKTSSAAHVMSWAIL